MTTTTWTPTNNGETATVGCFTVRVFPDATWTAYDVAGTRVVVREGRIGTPVSPYTTADWDNHGFNKEATIEEAKAAAVRVMVAVVT
jgi:hypothetical protein